MGVFGETDQYIHVAVQAEVVPQDRTEKGKLRNLPLPAEAGDFFFVPAMLIFQVLYGVFLFWKIALTNSAVEWKGRVYAGNKGSVEKIVG